MHVIKELKVIISGSMLLTFAVIFVLVIPIYCSYYVWNWAYTDTSEKLGGFLGYIVAIGATIFTFFVTVLIGFFSLSAFVDEENKGTKKSES